MNMTSSPTLCRLPLPFSIAEFHSRLSKVKQRMQQAGVEDLFVISEANISYLTGYQGNSAYVPQGLLITLSEAEPVMILREMDIPCALGTTWLSRDNILCYDERILGLASVPIWSAIGRLIRSRTRGQRLAVERNAIGLGVDGHAALIAALGSDQLMNADGWLNTVRAVKSPAELAYMREAGQIVDQALAAGIDQINVGVHEADVGATIVGRLCTGLPDAPGGAPFTAVTMPVTPCAGAPHLNWSNRRYAADSQTNFEVGAYRYRYCAAVSRTVFLGKPGARLREIDTVVRDAFEATLPAIHSGNRCSEVYAAFWKAFEGRGVRKESRIGYGIGIDWTEGSYSLQRDDERVLLPDSTVHLIIGIWEPAEGYVFSETLRVTDAGPESFSSLPRQLYVVT